MYLAVGGDRLRPHRPLHPPRVWASLGTLCPPNLCIMGDRSSPSVMVSLVNPLIREVSRELWLGAGGGVGDPDIHGFTPLCRLGSCLLERRCPGEDERGDRRG